MKIKKTPDQWLTLSIFLLIVVFFAAAFMMGCSSFVRVSEADRELVHQSLEAMKQVEAAVAGTLAVVACSDVGANLSQLQEVLGVPEAPIPYTTANSKATREKSASDHAASPIWGWLKTGGIFLLNIALGMGGLEMASRRFPAILSVGRALKAAVEKVDAEAPGDVTKRLVNSNPIVKKVWDAIPDPQPPSPPT